MTSYFPSIQPGISVDFSSKKFGEKMAQKRPEV
jgi:hypothetical protein